MSSSLPRVAARRRTTTPAPTPAHAHAPAPRGKTVETMRSRSCRTMVVGGRRVVRLRGARGGAAQRLRGARRRGVAAAGVAKYSCGIRDACNTLDRRPCTGKSEWTATGVRRDPTWSTSASPPPQQQWQPRRPRLVIARGITGFSAGEDDSTKADRRDFRQYLNPAGALGVQLEVGRPRRPLTLHRHGRTVV